MLIREIGSSTYYVPTTRLVFALSLLETENFFGSIYEYWNYPVGLYITHRKIRHTGKLTCHLIRQQVLGHRPHTHLIRPQMPSHRPHTHLIRTAIQSARVFFVIEKK